MDLSALDTIDDPHALRQAARALLATAQTTIERQQALIDTRERTITLRDAQIAALTAEIARLRRLQFSAKTERMDPDQRQLFEDTMAADIAAVEAQLAALQAEGETAAVTQKRRRAASAGRKPLPEHLERVETRHEPANCNCPQCNSALVAIGEHVSERLACKPLEFYVKRDVYPQYCCRRCELIVAEPVAAAIIERGQADASLLAQVAVAKYVDHLPLYRQEAIYARSGVALSRSTMAEWIGAIGVALQPLADRLAVRMQQQSVLHADETPVQLLDPTAGSSKRAYLFAYATAHHPGADPPMVVFQFQTSRSGQHARDFLGKWRGALMVDDYSVYKASFAQGVTELGCWAHARRKWHEQHAASGSAIAAEAIARIGVLYTIEAAASALKPDERLAYRQEHAVPVLSRLNCWLLELQQTVMGNSGTARALAYTLKRWDALTRYVQDGRYPIDNNLIENAIRPVALGRKNWLFAGSAQAGRRAAAIMSLLATAKANGIEPHAWLHDTLARLPTTLDRDIDQLLPLRTE
ncbi:IS66 family transposase [Xanthomonas cucurbitae]|uniref:IS66 family transposase n=1 Tax=Xanthomonas cucurbitae TaxID=56453 RepID=UPI00132F07DF|nr:IS66 family transposase [Xanthomonas cucurbitae]QHG88389.1 IS66 family transposase [Xanthomonas cucurbitae]